MTLPWGKIANAVGYQAVWFATLISASQGHFWTGFVCSLIFAGLTLWFGGKAAQDCRMAGIALILGISIDSLFAASGWIEYAMAWSLADLAPLWIIALWIAFSFTLNHSMAFLRSNYKLAALFGFLGGPLAYWGAQRLFNVIDYGVNFAAVMFALGICWAIALPAIFYIDRHFANSRHPLKAVA